MRVLLIGDYPPPAGGVAIHVQQLHGFLADAGVEVRGLDIGKGGRPVPDVLPVRHPVQYLRALVQALGESFLVHLHTSGNNPKSWALMALTALPWPDSKRVITLHSGLLPDYLRTSAWRRQLARTVLTRYHRIFVVSEAQREALVSCGVPPEKLFVQAPFLAEQLRPEPAPEAWTRARAQRTPLLAMAHHPSPVYGRSLAFAALAQLSATAPQVGLAVFGPGTTDPAFWAEAKAAGVSDRVENLGELNHGQALAVISGADVFLRPTTHDGDSISVREALALGTRCVASDVSSRPEGTFVFKARDAEALAACVRRALASPVPAAIKADSGQALLTHYQQLNSTFEGRTLHATHG